MPRLARSPRRPEGSPDATFPLTTLAVALAAAPLVASTLSPPATAAAAPGDHRGDAGPAGRPAQGGRVGRRHRVREPELRGPPDQEGPGPAGARRSTPPTSPTPRSGASRSSTAWLTFTTTKGKVGKVMKRTKQGKIREVANIWLHEKANNPDGGNDVRLPGTRATSASRTCRTSGTPTRASRSRTPTRPSGSARSPYVADAAANAIFKVAADGTVEHGRRCCRRSRSRSPTSRRRPSGCRTASSGETYCCEPVPTDVERGRRRHCSTSRRSPAVQRTAAWAPTARCSPSTRPTASAEQIVAGLVSPTGLAVTDTGDLFVAQLFGNSIVRDRGGVDDAGALPPREPARRRGVDPAGRLRHRPRCSSNNRGKLTRFPLP